MIKKKLCKVVTLSLMLCMLTSYNVGATGASEETTTEEGDNLGDGTLEEETEEEPDGETEEETEEEDVVVKKEVVLSFDKKTREIKMSTEGDGTIIYAHKMDVGGIGSSKRVWQWGIKEYIEDVNDKLIYYTDDKETWSVYDSESFDSDMCMGGDNVWNVFACVDYGDGTYSEVKNVFFEASTEPPKLSVSVSYSSDLSSATISYSASSKNELDVVINETTGVKSTSKQGSFKVTKNTEYNICAYDNYGNYTSEIAAVTRIVDANEGMQESDIVETKDTKGPTIEITGIVSKKTDNFTVVVKAKDESGIRYIQTPSGHQYEKDKIEFLIEENGVFEFKAVDKFGNVSKKSITVKNIDGGKDSNGGNSDSSSEDLDDKEIALGDANGSSGKDNVTFGTLPQTGGIGLPVMIGGISVALGVGVYALYLAGRKKLRESEEITTNNGERVDMNEE